MVIIDFLSQNCTHRRGTSNLWLNSSYPSPVAPILTYSVMSQILLARSGLQNMTELLCLSNIIKLFILIPSLNQVDEA